MSADGRMPCAALTYAERFGFAVFPVRPRAKTPLTQHGFKDAMVDPAIIKTWWSGWPEANIGITTGLTTRIIVLDVDHRHGGDDTLSALEEKHERLRGAPTVITGGGGLHLYFAYPLRVDRIPTVPDFWVLGWISALTEAMWSHLHQFMQMGNSTDGSRGRESMRSGSCRFPHG
jgi:Bifunctional DNA primase/polymerase, N-terminal